MIDLKKLEKSLDETLANETKDSLSEWFQNKNSELMSQETKIIFRIELPEDRNGMWYNKDGELDKKIHLLCPHGIAKDFPMPLNLELHRKDGEIWNSGGKSIENMNEWFTPLDAKNLMNNGFKLFQFEVNMYQELAMEILFCRKGIISQKEISLDKIWNMDLSK